MTPYGCFTRHPRPPSIATHLVQDGWTPDGRRRLVQTPCLDSSNCKYDLRTKDARCQGCAETLK